MPKSYRLILCLILGAWFILGYQNVMAQGVTTSSITGQVKDTDGNALPSANVMAVHTPSGTQYGASTRTDGRFAIQGMRVGGPYTVTVSYVGFESQSAENINLSLGLSTDLEFVLRDASIEIEAVTVTTERGALFSPERTGSSTSINTEALEVLPTISRRLSDFTRLTPEASGNSIAGQDNRLNNITVDGSYFNNSFGLAGAPGERTNVAPISIDAIEQIQLNIAPYDVRQGNFVGAGVNTVTKSGNNDFSGSVYYLFRNEASVGTQAGDNTFNPGTFDYNQIGVRLGGPIVKNKLFFFGSFESEALTQPGTTYLSNTGSQTVGGSVTRVLSSDLDQLSNYLRTNFGYETGGYQNYDFETPALRFLLRLDYNLDDRNKISLRYNHLDSDTDVLLSNSSSLGFGNRRSNLTGLNFQNSNYIILENIRSIVGEWNTSIGDNMANNLIVGYTYNDESRDADGTLFPFVDILEEGSVYTSFGFEPFTPSNELRYNSFQVQNNFTMFMQQHYLTFGLSAEIYNSENVFFPGSQSVYVYNSLADFYADADGYLANPNRTEADSTLRRFQVRWSNQPGQDKPIQPLEVFYGGLYAQDEWQVNHNLRLTIGVRADVPFFGETGFKNTQVDTLFFADEGGNQVQYQTDKMPDANILFSPRVGFNWDVTGERTTQVRGGTGIFTGRPAYVWISNQIGENGVLTGFEQIDNTTSRPFHPDINHYKQEATGNPASSYGLAFTDPEFKFPQIWRSNIAVDQKLLFDLVGTVEFIYSQDVNGVYYINANLDEPNSQFTGPDARPRWVSDPNDPNPNRINNNISSAIVLKNQNEGFAYNISAALEKPFSDNWYAKVAYSYGISKNTVDPGSIAFGSWNNNPHSGDPNNPGVAFSGNTLGNRIFAALSYRFGSADYTGSIFGATTVSAFWEGAAAQGVDPFFFPSRRGSYTFSGDLNGDGGTNNDLIYIPADKSEMNFEEFTSGGVTYTVEQQENAWDAFIEQDDYLKENRGKYAERGGVELPMVFRADISLIQDIYFDILNKKNAFQLRLDFINIGNLVNKEWGVGELLVTTQPLIARPSADGEAALYRLRVVDGKLLSKSTQGSSTINDVFRIQFGVRYTFN
ncbi:MAG TPA: carboxypeptidase regulatory-like domain-containing protein [Ignavibacteriaceae bacterium]|nr:carboxypeptidase regulatory-like domain-containing protein [Ignavibacteriaceae bacterium]